MTQISTDINYPTALFPKSYKKSMYDEMIESGEIEQEKYTLNNTNNNETP